MVTLLTGTTGKVGHVRTSDSSKTLTVESIEELNTRSMHVQSPHSSHLTAVGSHAQTSISRLAPTVSTHISGCARVGSRSGAGVGIDAASTTVKRFLNGDARGRSEAKLLDGHAAASHSTGCRLDAKPRTASCSRVCSDSDATLTVARARTVRVRLSRSRWMRAKCASRRLPPDECGARERDHVGKSSRRAR